MGSVMASTYNRRPLPAEVLVQTPAADTHDGTTWRVIRRRQTIDELLSTEL